MSEKIVPLNLIDIKKTLGTHKYEIIDISTEWCGPCKRMKKAMIKLFDTPEFSGKDLCVYLIDGDTCSEVQHYLDVVKNMEKEGLSFPMDIQDFTNYMKKSNEFNRLKIDEIAKQAISCLGLELKENKVYETDTFKELKNTMLPTEEFEVEGYPTLIFYKDGKPITTPIDETDYDSRGIYRYEKEKLEEFDLSESKIMEVTIEETVGKKKVNATFKVIQLNPKCDARIVGFADADTLKKHLLTFLSM